ncbi:hypothetical protein [Flavobacterium sp.]|uniref:hypothetical protein n=1 Tax=Flavobacterium sp. TaxID=239 RepID=UPI003D0A0C1C
MKKILPVFSYIFHPIFIPFYTICYYFSVTREYYLTESIYLYLKQTLLITFLIPLAVFYLLVTYKKIDTIMAGKVTQRRIPLLLQTLLFLSLVIKTFTLENTPLLFYFILASAVSSSSAYLLTFWKKKISLHMLGIVSMTVFIIITSKAFQLNNFMMIASLLLLNGVVASSRLALRAHTYEELIQGFYIGAVPQMAIVYFL